MKKRKNRLSSAPGSSSGRHLFAGHTKKAPRTRSLAPVLLGTGIFLSAATLVSSLVLYLHPLALGDKGVKAGVEAGVGVDGASGDGIPGDGAGGVVGRGVSGDGTDTAGHPAGSGSGTDGSGPESMAGPDSNPGAGPKGSGSPRVVGPDDSEDPNAPLEIGELADLDMEAFATEEGIVYSAILDTAIGPMVYYSQGDARWRDFLYGGADPMKKYGCGPTAVAMLISSFSLSGSSVTPQDMAEWAAANGHYATHSGSYHSLIPQALAAYGLQVEGVADRSREHVEALLKSGHVLVALMGRGALTENGHFVLITRMRDNGYVSIADPNRYENCKKDWDLGGILSELKGNYDSGGPLWAVARP